MRRRILPYYRSIDLSAASTQTIDGSTQARKATDPLYLPPNEGFPVVESLVG